MLGLFKLYNRTRDPTYLQQLDSTLSWVERCQSDPVYGEWYWTVTATCQLPTQPLTVGSVNGYGSDQYPPDVKVS